MFTRTLYIFILGILLIACSRTQQGKSQTAAHCLEEAVATMENDGIRLCEVLLRKTILLAEQEEFFHMTFPHYYRLIAIDHHLTRDQLRLCLLIRLSFTPYAIKKVMDIDGARITRLKIQTNSRLFNERRASTLESNLKLHF